MTEILRTGREGTMLIGGVLGADQPVISAFSSFVFVFVLVLVLA